jgi:AraC family transcriptional regulator of adaptative response/methylated-DNA-[protein]-cysteine methyltransferase
MHTHRLPSRERMLAAFLGRDATFEGVFVTAVHTTGIFCRPTCPARKPRPEHVEFYASPRDALLAGYRPCARCRPLEPAGAAPSWLRDLLAAVEREPVRRWRESDLHDRGLHPERVRRWFRREHGMTFHDYCRSRALGHALGRLQKGDDVTTTALDHGYDSLSGFHEAFRKHFGESPTAARGRRPVLLERLVTPLGPMIAGASDEGLCLLEFADRRMLPTEFEWLRRRWNAAFATGPHPHLAGIRRELAEYFAGTRRTFETPLATPGSEFQRAVWAELRTIPFGTTRSYAQQARALGRPAAVRAVARANGDNRIAIVIPCHRVIGSDGQLTGYGGGLWRKQRLIDHERANLARREAMEPSAGDADDARAGHDVVQG